MNNIETLHTIYIVCMTAAIIMLVISIVLFFLFDIRHIIGRMLGFSEKKAIKEMEENNSFTSQLQQKYNVKMKDKVFTNSGSLKKNQSPAEKLGMSRLIVIAMIQRLLDTLPKRQLRFCTTNQKRIQLSWISHLSRRRRS